MARPRCSQRGALSVRLPTGSEPTASVAGASWPITPNAIMTRCSAADFLGWVGRIFTHKWMQVVLAIHKPEHIDPPIFPGRQLDDALGLLPGIGNRGIKRKASFIKI